MMPSSFGQHQSCYQQGVVLISAVLVLMVLSMITVYYMQQARQFTHQVRDFRQKAQYCVFAEQYFDAVVMELLSNERNQLNGKQASLISGEESDTGFWNFYDQPFEYQQALVRIQDMAGLLSIDGLQGTIGQRLLLSLGVDGEQLRIFNNSLQDWQDADGLHRIDGAEEAYYSAKGLPGPRNARLGAVTELRLVRGYPHELDPLLASGMISLYPQPYFNPLTAPEPLLSAFLNNVELARRVVEARSKTPLTLEVFTAMTGIQQSPLVLMAPSLEVRVTVSMADESRRCEQSMILDMAGDTGQSYTLRAAY